MNMAWRVLMWIGIFLSGTVIMTLFWIIVIAIANGVINLVDRIFGNGWRF